ncbi:MAG: LCP family protein [Spirochaetaceae bacterium]|nr:LCP family protein [Spirochaetaceae bacterium]
MKKFRIDKSAFFLIAIMLIVVVTSVVLIVSMRPDPIADALQNDPLLNILIVLEDEGRPLLTNVLIYYPPSRRAAIFDIPSETGLIISTLGRMDRIDALYTERDISAYLQEIEKLLGVAIPFYMVMDMDDFSALTDLLGGLKVFIPVPVDILTETERWLLPSGAVTLDGDKIRTYINYAQPEERDTSLSERRQNSMTAFLWALGENSRRMFSREFFPAVKRYIDSNLEDIDLNKLLSEIARADTERLSPQTVTGSVRLVDGQQLLFPYYDGQLIKDIVRQTTGTLASSGDITHERIYVIEILNGTTVQGLARNTSALYQSFGYDVMNVANADLNDYAETIIIDHIGDQATASNIGEIIRCTRFKSTEIKTDQPGNYETNSLVDFTIILGRDFDGRYVR